MREAERTSQGNTRTTPTAAGSVEVAMEVRELTVKPRRGRWGLLRKQVDKLQVLELGGESGGELGPVASFAHAACYLQERLHGAG